MSDHPVTFGTVARGGQVHMAQAIRGYSQILCRFDIDSPSLETTLGTFPEEGGADSTIATLREAKVRPANSTRSKAPFGDRFAKGIRDAQLQLEAILHLWSDDPGALRKNVRAYLAEGPAWDSEAYLDGGAAVHDDVSAILDGDRRVIEEMLTEDEEN